MQLLRNVDMSDCKRAALPELRQAGTQIEFLVDDPAAVELYLNVDEGAVLNLLRDLAVGIEDEFLASARCVVLDKALLLHRSASEEI